MRLSPIGRLAPDFNGRFPSSGRKSRVAAGRTTRHSLSSSSPDDAGRAGSLLRAEVNLAGELSPVPYLLVRRPVDLDFTQHGEAETLRRLWPMLPRLSVIDYKSPPHPYRSGDLDQLWAYLHVLFANQRGLTDSGEIGSRGEPDVSGREDLCAVLVVASRTPGLEEDVATMGLRWEDVGGGYWRVCGGLFALYVVEIDAVGAAEEDDLLCSFGSGGLGSPEARQFWAEILSSNEGPMSVREREGYDEVMGKLLRSLPIEEVLSHFTPSEVLSHYAPEQRLAGLDHDHQALALPLDVLRLLPEDYLSTLSPEVQVELRQRLARP